MDSEMTNFVRLRGLPFSASEDEIRTFFGGLNVKNITRTSTFDGRPSGEAFCEMGSKNDVEEALKLDRKEMKNRYIEVFSVKAEEVKRLKDRGVVSDEGKVVRLRGLPFSADVDEIKNFFTGLDCEEVVIGRTGGRPSGEAFVRLATKEQATKALEFNRQNMGSRYIEVFRTTPDDLEHTRDGGGGFGRGPKRSQNLPPFDYGDPRFHGAISHPRRDDYRSAPYHVPAKHLEWGPPRGDAEPEYYSPTRIYMRGLPFDADAYMIEAFFSPLTCLEVKIAVSGGRPTGEGSVEFGTMAEAKEALYKDKSYMGERYIELYSAETVPTMLRRQTYKRIGGRPAPPPQPLSSIVVPPPPGPAGGFASGDRYHDEGYGYGRGGGYYSDYNNGPQPAFRGRGAAARSTSNSSYGYGRGGYGYF